MEIAPGSRVVAEASSAMALMRSSSRTVYTPAPPAITGTIGKVVSFRIAPAIPPARSLYTRPGRIAQPPNSMVMASILSFARP